MSSSSRSPILDPSFTFGTVVILSTITWQGACNPLRSLGMTGQAEKGSVGRVGREGTQRDRTRTIEAIILDDHGGPGLSGVVLAPRDRPDASAFHSEIASMNS